MIRVANNFCIIETGANHPPLHWVIVPKNGSTYVKRRLNLPSDGTITDFFYYNSKNPGPNITKNGPSPVSALETIDVPRMVVYREPIGRVISSYLELLKTKNVNPIVDTSETTRRLKFYSFKDNLEKSFDFFLKEIKDIGFYDVHLYPQSYYIKKIDLFQHLIDLVDLDNSLNSIFKMYEIPNKNYTQVEKRFTNAGDSAVKNKLMELIHSKPEWKTDIRSLYEQDFNLYERIKERNENNIYS